MHSAALFLVMAGSKMFKSKPKAVRQQIKSILDSRVEHKRISATGALSDLASAGIVNAISVAVAQGDDISNRSGDIIRPVKLVVRIQFTTGNATATQQYLGRYIVFQDRFANGATPAVTDILTTAVPLSGYNVVNRQAKRFKILADSDVAMVGSTNMANKFIELNFPMKGSIHYLTTTGTASQGSNSLFVLFITNNVSAGVFQYAWSYDFEYTDA